MEYDGIGESYQDLTKYVRGSLPDHDLDWGAQPSLRKDDPNAIRTVELPSPETEGGPPLWKTLQARRSERAYAREPISVQQLSQLLWATQGTTRNIRHQQFRTAPSAGALYPIETYLVVNRVDGLDPGLYHYDALGGALKFLREGNLGPEAAATALDQPMVESAAVVFIWTAIPERGKWKYLERAYRYIYLDAGHIAQNLYLAAGGMGLGCCAIGALYDEEVNRLVEVDGTSETVVYMCSVGKL
jgi:SagB-type dehydrogenase family enzyme